MTQKKTMTLDEFAAYIQEELPKLMAEKYDPKQYKFSVFKVRKNNGVELTALSVSKLGEAQWISPTFSKRKNIYGLGFKTDRRVFHDGL